MSETSIAHVAVDSPLTETLSYKQNSNFQVQRGDVVEVPLGKRTAMGVVVRADNAAPIGDFEMKPISSLHPEWPRLNEKHLKWLEWMADYYLHPLGKVLQLCFPPLSRTKKAEFSERLGREKKVRVSDRPSVVPHVEMRTPHKLNIEQQKCVDDILAKSGFSAHLIHGVTGSGKTEIYLELFEHVMKKGKRGLFLLPEIALTPQLVQRFAQRFGDQIGVLHSQLTDRERTNQWWEIAQGHKKILIGARSALFCPIDDLGLIVVDEEHESSFKQDEKLKYNGRDCAVMLAHFHSCPVILGSATPSLDSWKNAQEGKYHLHQIKNRVNNRPLPEITVVDMREEKQKTSKVLEKPSWMSQKLYDGMLACFERDEQVALLLNRRGMAQMVFCPSCGHTADCPNCDISLSLHAKTHLVCHYCDYHENFKLKCPDCTEGQLIQLGLGTEKIEDDLKQLFPDRVVARADRDEVSSRLEMEELVHKMENSEIDILVGTQMIAKGLDFSNLKLVGLVLADISFNLPDFRAAEKSFQLITQMSGRSGRHVKENESAGQVIVQTYNTGHESILFSQNHDYEGFAANELMHRLQLHYPPYSRLGALRIQSQELGKVQETSRQLAERAHALKNKFSAFETIEILGPASAPLAKLRNQFRYHLLLKCPQPQVLNQFIRKLMGNSKWIPKQTKVVVDIDPLNLL